MEEPSTSTSNYTSITDIDEDALSHCVNYLTLQDVSNMAMSCNHLKRIAYSDSVWHHLYRKQWPQQIHSSFVSGVRDAYLARHSALRQFKFVDPLVADFFTEAKPYSHILVDGRNVILSQGSSVQMLNMDKFLSGRDSLIMLNDHKARITCMRLFSLGDTSLFRSESKCKENVLVTSSCDHSIRLWYKGSCQRCLRGHNGPVLTLADKLLVDGNGKVLASGGEDGTIRLWSLTSSGKRGHHALKATLHGHERPLKLLSVAGHKTSLLVSISRDSKVRVWDTTMSSAGRSSCCVGMITVPSAPVSMRCHEALLYFAAGCSVAVIDLRTMQKVSSMAVSQSKLYAFEIMPEKHLVCTGENGRAMLWDVRMNQDSVKPKPVTELDGHNGPVVHLFMDTHKIVTGTSDDVCINVWSTDNGKHTNSLICCSPEEVGCMVGCSAMAVNGCKIITAAHGGERGLLRYRDFANARFPVPERGDPHTSKFWNAGSESSSDTESYSDIDV